MIVSAYQKDHTFFSLIRLNQFSFKIQTSDTTTLQSGILVSIVSGALTKNTVFTHNYIAFHLFLFLNVFVYLLKILKDTFKVFF